MDVLDELKESCPTLIEGAAKEPEYQAFINTTKAAQILYKHTVEHPDSVKAVHGDVDVDGIASALVFHRLFGGLGCIRYAAFVINKMKEHGIKAMHANWARRNNVSLVVIVDSSANDLDVIKAMPCDVLVFDHHKVDHTELTGKTAGGEYVIVTNMVDGDQLEADTLRARFNQQTQATKQPKPAPTQHPGFRGLDDLDGGPVEQADSKPNILASTGPYQFKTDADMSGCMVGYEFCRVFERLYNLPPIVEEAKVYQWVGVSLLTDAISTANERNQWYMAKTVNTSDLEVALAQIIPALSKYQRGLDKSFIQFTMAPAINSAIRAGSSLEALDTILNYPSRIANLRTYRSKQLKAIEEAERVTEEHDTYVLLDITDSEKADKGYCGVISTKLVDRTGKNAGTYVLTDKGACKGSFRGRCKDTDYIGCFAEAVPGVFAQGHDGAFGFECSLDDLRRAMESLPKAEKDRLKQLETTAGDMPAELQGKYHISDMAAYIRAGKIMEMGIANGRLSTKEEHVIIVPLSDAKEIPSEGKLHWYEVLGLKCKSFEALKTPYVSIYPELTSAMNIYVKNYKI